jgi:hypothetical protein
MTIEISLIQRTNKGEERRVEKSFDSGQSLGIWYEKQPKYTKGQKQKDREGKRNQKVLKSIPESVEAESK